ncbi:MAG: CHRD domain-containing protein [Candidatus Omnitrophica bacterium]|nr:CHRD domain-containing protein [Candidatus Omnitrophota bacterium]
MKGYSKCLLYGLCLVGLAVSIPLRAATITVEMVEYAFQPANLTINMGDTVTWTNAGAFQHTSTSGNSPPASDGLWDSGIVQPGGTFSHTFTTAGTFPYFCAIHYFLGMTGVITVQGANVPPAVAINSPTNGASYISPANITIQAAASDSDGTVTQVQFFDATNLLGVVNTSPYDLPVTLYPGSNSLTTVATDNLGASTTSAPVTVSVGTIEILDPLTNHITKGPITIELKTILDGLASPLGMAVPDDGSGRMFVYDQAGKAWIVTSTGALTTPFIDVHNRLVAQTTYDERGFIGLATHPNFAQHPLVYTYTSEPVSGPADFTDTNPPNGTNNCQNVLAEWQIDSSNTNRVDPSTRRELLRIDKPYENHNGGTLMFGPDGYLYLSTGDGGGADDVGPGHLAPDGNAQSLQRIYGKILRIDVNGTNSANGQYGIPSDNPFVGTSAVQEIYAYGLRNPYKYSFDSVTGNLYAGDAGENTVEEVDYIVKGGNYGWNNKEGSFWFDSIASDPNFGFVVTGPVRPVPPNLIDPLAEYDHFDGHVVIGGYVYWGSQIPALQGRYVFGDWGSFAGPSARLFYLDTNNVIKEFHIGLEDRPAGFWLKGFGQDPSGEMYVFGSRMLGPAGNTGTMLKIIPPPAPLTIVSARDQGGTNLAVSWMGGTGPFALQKKFSLNDETWMNTGFTTNQQADTQLAASAAFFRVTDTAHQLPTPLSAYLSGTAERPNPVTTSGTGLALFSLDGNTFRFTISYSGLSGPATAAHIHGPADTSGSAGVLVSLMPYAVGTLGATGGFSGTIVIPDDLKSMIQAGLTYVNIHTANNPAGEIRGQITPVLMQASASGAQEVPTVATSGHALGEFTLVGNQLSFNITYRELSTNAFAAHIHGPAPIGSNAPVMISLEPFNGGAFGSNGVLAGSVTLTPDQLTDVIAGMTYVNIHTANNPAGEIRGQILPQSTGIPLSAAISAAAEIPPPTATTGSGEGLLSLEGDTLRFSITYSNLSSPAFAAHIHGPASTTQTAPVEISLEQFNGGSFGTSGQLAGSVEITPAQRDMLLGGLGYVNIHTTNNPAGEIRGQVAPVLMETSLSGVNERPDSVASNGSGFGIFALVNDQLTFDITYADLSGTATAADIQGPATLFAPAGVLVDLAPFNGGAFGAFGSLSGTTTLSLTNLANVIDGMTYVNIHTSLNPTGEIRGQITP